MCESTVYLIEGGEKVTVMEEAAKVKVSGTSIMIVSLSGERKTLESVEFSEADLMRHEIILRPRKG
jgi:predicted RNA-binding protein